MLCAIWAQASSTAFLSPLKKASSNFGEACASRGRARRGIRAARMAPPAWAKQEPSAVRLLGGLPAQGGEEGVGLEGLADGVHEAVGNGLVVVLQLVGAA